MANFACIFLYIIFFAIGAFGKRSNVGQHAISLRADVQEKLDAVAQEEPRRTTNLSTKTNFWAWLGNDHIHIDAAEAENKLRISSNVLLPAEEERVIMAFKVGNDKTFFTSKRILFRPKGWLFSSAVEYEAVPYSSIIAFEIKTAGGWPDMDTDLILRTGMAGLPVIKIGFRKGSRSEKVNIFDVMKFINARILGPESGSSFLEVANTGKNNSAADVLHFLGGNAHEVDSSASERIFKETFPILQQDETVEMAFKVGRDSTLLTSKRMVRIDVQGISGKGIKFQSIPWSCVQAYAVQTAGTFDADAEMMIWTNIPSLRMITQDLRKGRADVIAIQRFFSDKILSTKAEPLVLPPQHAPPIGQKQVDEAKELLHWLGGDLSSFNPAEAEARLRAVVPILQEDEHVELAYGKRRGTGDMAYLTTKRILYVDQMRNMFFQKDKVQYISIPYASVKAFSVETAGGRFDFDCEFTVWTNIQHEMTPGGENSPPEPIPGVTMLSFDVRKGTDVFVIQRFLYAKVLGGISSASALLQQEAVAETSSPNDVFHWLGNNAAEISAQEVASMLTDSAPVLQPGEEVLKAFKTYRDMSLLTTTRVLVVDVQGLSGKKVEYLTVPYTSIGAFGVRSAGALDADEEFMLYTVMPWPTMAVVSQDLRKGTSNLAEIQALFCRQILGNQMTDKDSLEMVARAQGAEPGANKDHVLDFLGGNARKIPAAEAEASLSTNPHILQRGERVSLAYKVGKDMAIFTTHRILMVDVADIEFFRKNPKVEYRTIPYSKVLGFSVKTAGNSLDRDEEIKAYTDMPAFPGFKQDIAKGNDDIFDVQKLLSQKVLA